jgi:hypothetical protein
VCFIPRQTGRLTVGRNITETQTQPSYLIAGGQFCTGNRYQEKTLQAGKKCLQEWFVVICREAVKFSGFSYFRFCSTTKIIYLGWVREVRTMKGRAIAQEVSRRLPTAAARVQTRVWSCGILWWTKVALGQVFSENFGFLYTIYIPSASPQSSSLSPEAGTIGQEWPQCQQPHKPNK